MKAQIKLFRVFGIQRTDWNPCLSIAAGIGWNPTSRLQSPGAAMLGWLGVINLTLAVFNMIYE